MKNAVIVALGLLAIRAGVGTAAEPPASDEGAVFAARCGRCHGDSGMSDTPQGRALKVRPLAGDAALAAKTPEQIAVAIRSDAKHQAMGALEGVDEKEIDAAAGFVKVLAEKR